MVWSVVSIISILAIKKIPILIKVIILEVNQVIGITRINFVAHLFMTADGKVLSSGKTVITNLEIFV